jgi:ketosteroid isomerase-like protein
VDDQVQSHLKELDEQWMAAIVKNDAPAIGTFMSPDWVIIGPEGGLINRDQFLHVIKSGDLVHDSMASDDWRVRVYGDTAVVTAQTRSKGAYRGQPFATHERSTSVFIRRDGRWLCVLTHLTPISKK